MEYRQLGASGLRVSNLCLGTMTFGEADETSFMHKVGCDEQTSFSIMDKALEAGINFFDTADVYGQDGLSERIIGNWFEKSGHRDDVVLATKFRFVMGSGPNRTGGSRYRIVRTVEDSLRRLKTDRIDLYQMHMQDVSTPIEETLRALDDLVRAGKVLYIGCSNYAAFRIANALWTSTQQGLERFVSAQMQYNLLNRGIEREHLPLCKEEGVGILPWSPLAGGFLTGKYRKDQDPPEGTRLGEWKDRYSRYDVERNWTILEAIDAVSEQTRHTPSQVALAWLLRKPAVTSVIFGARSIEQVTDNVEASQLWLTDDQMAKLDEAATFELGYPYEFMGRIQGRW